MRSAVCRWIQRWHGVFYSLCNAEAEGRIPMRDLRTLRRRSFALCRLFLEHLNSGLEALG